LQKFVSFFTTSLQKLLCNFNTSTLLFFTEVVLVGIPEGKIPLGRPRRRWEDNVKMNLREVGGVETRWSLLRIGTDGGHL